MLTACHMTTRRPALLPLLAVLLSAPGAAEAVPSNRSIALEAAGISRPGGPSGAAALSAACWLDGDLEAQVRLTAGSVAQPAGRGTAGAVTAEAGLRWVDDEGRWRPLLGVALGARLPAAAHPAALAGLAQAGLERDLGPGWALGAALGLRWVQGEGAAAEAALGLRLYF